MRLEEAEHPAAERAHALYRLGAGPERWLAAYQRVLELARALVEQRHHEPGAVAEATEQRPLADARLGRDRVHRDLLHAALLDQLCSGREDAAAVTGCVGALARLRVDGRKRLWPRYDV